MAAFTCRGRAPGGARGAAGAGGNLKPVPNRPAVERAATDALAGAGGKGLVPKGAPMGVDGRRGRAASTGRDLTAKHIPTPSGRPVCAGGGGAWPGRKVRAGCSASALKAAGDTPRPWPPASAFSRAPTAPLGRRPLPPVHRRQPSPLPRRAPDSMRAARNVRGPRLSDRVRGARLAGPPLRPQRPARGKGTPAGAGRRAATVDAAAIGGRGRGAPPLLFYRPVLPRRAKAGRRALAAATATTAAAAHWQAARDAARRAQKPGRKPRPRARNPNPIPGRAALPNCAPLPVFGTEPWRRPVLPGPRLRQIPKSAA